MEKQLEILEMIQAIINKNLKIKCQHKVMDIK